VRKLLAVLLVTACSGEKRPAPAAGPGARPPLTSVMIDGVPHVEQRPDFCGEACVAMWLGKLGHGGDQDWVFDQAGLDPTSARGVYSAELGHALDTIGFDIGKPWRQIPAGDADALDGLFAELHADLVRGVPSIVCMHYDDSPGTTEHFRLVLGYDADKDEVIYHEPGVADGAYHRLSRPLFLKLWPLKYEPDQHTVIRFRLAGRPSRAGAAASAPTAADVAQHIRALRERAPKGFTIAWSPPFVVVGDGRPEEVRRRATGTVAWAVRMLKQQYFAADPDHVIDVWLFKDDESYERNVRELFGEKPTTPFGWYSPQKKALIMNISTGGGTLVHEIVHPFVRANFPEAPAWLNEGLGSLYEQSDERGGKIVGLTNWRLAGLKEVIRAGELRSFQELIALDDGAFYGDDAGANYAQARYLLYYLQEQGKLERFYHAFHAARAKDPTGWRTLQDVLGERDMKVFQRRWEKWVVDELVFED
jgi:hypothetical protein